MRKLQFWAVWSMVILAELLAAAVPAAVVAGVFVPRAYKQRGYVGMGGEWFLIAAVFCAAYTITHKWVCKKLFEEG